MAPRQYQQGFIFFQYCLKTILPLRSALPIQDVNIHKANGIGGTIVYFLNRQDEYSSNWEFADFLGGSPGISYLKSELVRHYICGVTAERNILSPLCLFVPFLTHLILLPYTFMSSVKISFCFGLLLRIRFGRINLKLDNFWEKNNFLYWLTGTRYRKKRLAPFPFPARMPLTKLSLFPPRESLVSDIKEVSFIIHSTSDIPAGEGNVANIFL